MKNLRPVDVIIVTFNNEQYLLPAVESIIATRRIYPVRVIIVNNGHPSLKSKFPSVPYIKFVQAPGNLGWVGGLKKGLEYSDSPFVCFANDDIFVPYSSDNWMRNLLETFGIPSVFAAGPMSNVVMGAQQIFKRMHYPIIKTSYLIGFCMMVRRAMLDKMGGLDINFNTGGDDLDLSIRAKLAGYDLIARNDVFIYHWGFTTGERIYGKPDKKGGWNSSDRGEKVNIELIRKHGFKNWYDMIQSYPSQFGEAILVDAEAQEAKRWIKKGKIVEVGCGTKKTVPEAIGVDMYGKGELIPLIGTFDISAEPKSVADIKADVEKKLPFKDGEVSTIIARQILEHCLDLVGTLTEWRRILKKGGRLIIAAPDERGQDSIPLNSEHVHAFTPSSLRKLMESLGYRYISDSINHNSISFIGVYEK